MSKRKAPPDNIFGLPNKVGRPRKARNPFDLTGHSIVNKRRGRPPKKKPLVAPHKPRRRDKTVISHANPSTPPKSASNPNRITNKPYHPATQRAMWLVFLPATVLVFLTNELPQSVSGTICLGSLLIYPFVLTALHRQSRDETLADVTQPLSETVNYAPPKPALTGSDFEHEVAWIFNTISKYSARVVGGGGDGGVDVEIYSAGQLVGIAQCKRYDPARVLGPAPIRELYAVMHQKQVSVGYLFTTARITEQTEQEAGRLGVKLVYGARLMDMRHKARQTAGTAKYPTYTA